MYLIEPAALRMRKCCCPVVVLVFCYFVVYAANALAITVDISPDKLGCTCLQSDKCILLFRNVIRAQVEKPSDAYYARKQIDRTASRRLNTLYIWHKCGENCET